MSASPDATLPPPLGWRLLLGATSGLCAGILVGGLDALRCAEQVARQFESLPQRLWVALLTWLTPTLALTLAGAAVALLGHCVVRLVQRAASGTASPATRRRWLGRAGALLAAPAVAWVCTQIFSGPQAQRIPGHRPLAALLGVTALAGGNLALQLALRGAAWVDAGAPFGKRVLRALALLVPTKLAVLLLYAVDLKVLPRLYPWFHGSLQAVIVAAALVLGLWFCTALRLARRTALAMALTVAALAAGGWANYRLQRAQTLRGLVLEHTNIVSQVLRLERRLHGAPRRPLGGPPAADLAADAEPLPPAVSGPRLAGRDVFLITVDALRSDRVNPTTMPFVASLLPQAAVFTRAYTQVPHTSFAVATLLTGKPVYALMTLGQDAASHETLPLVLRRFRYKTAAFYPPSVFYVEHDRLRRLEETAYGFEYVKFEYLDAPARTTQLIHFLDEEKPPRVFAWVHYLEPHEPYDTHPGGPGPAAADRDRYDGEIRFVDDQIRRLYEYLQRTRPQALIVVAADHGEEFGEHGGRYHGTSLYEEQVHVPLLIVELHPPAAGRADEAARLQPQQLTQPVGLIDVAPTLLGLLDIEPSVRMRGHDLSPWLLSPTKVLPRWPVYSEIGRKKMVVRGDHKLICDFATDACQAFDLRADPQERRSILDSDPATSAELRAALDRYIAQARRFEEAPAAGSSAGLPTDAAQAAALSRGRMGDRSALPPLVTLLVDAQAAPGQRQAALPVVAQLLATALPEAAPGAPRRDPLLGEATLADPAVRRQLRRLFTAAPHATPAEVEQRRWAALIHLRLDQAYADGTPADELAATQGVAALVGDEHATDEQRLCGALVLAGLPACAVPPATPASPDAPARLDCTGLLLAALPAAMRLDDPDRVRPLLLRLGRRGDARALPPLLALLETVRSRPDVVQALGLLGDRRAVPAVAELLASDPYVPVRAAAATALGQLGGPAATAALRSASSHEREPLARAAITAALAGK